MDFHRCLLLLVLLLLVAGYTPGQAEGPFPEARYRELREELRFVPPAPTASRPAPAAGWEIGYWPTLVVLTVVSVGGLGFLAYRMWRDRRAAPPDGGPESHPAVISREINEEAIIRQAAPSGLLARAESEGRYALAARLLFLSLLGELQQAGILEWRRDFSNRDYLQQLDGHPLAADFRSVSAAYERFWYGSYPIDRLGYRALHLRVMDFRRRAALPAVSPVTP